MVVFSYPPAARSTRSPLYNNIIPKRRRNYSARFYRLFRHFFDSIIPQRDRNYSARFHQLILSMFCPGCSVKLISQVQQKIPLNYIHTRSDKIFRHGHVHFRVFECLEWGSQHMTQIRLHTAPHTGQQQRTLLRQDKLYSQMARA